MNDLADKRSVKRKIVCDECGQIRLIGGATNYVRAVKLCASCMKERRLRVNRERYRAGKPTSTVGLLKVVKADEFPVGVLLSKQKLEREWLRMGYFDDSAILEGEGKRYRVVREGHRQRLELDNRIENA